MAATDGKEMPNFALVSMQNDFEVDFEVNLLQGKVSIGRGPLMKITDKRVSRNHAMIEVKDNALSILPTHTNPTFYQALGEAHFEALDKDVSKELHDGDCISFLPNDLKFKVKILTQELLLKSDDFRGRNEMMNNMKGDNFYSADSLRDSHNGTSENSNRVNDVEKKRMPEETVSPLNKARVLPTWMTQGPINRKNKDEMTMLEKIKKSLLKSPSCRYENNLPNEQYDDEVVEERFVKSCDADNLKYKVEAVQSPSVVSVKRKCDDNEEEKNAKHKKDLTRCPYGSRCYRKNPLHFQEYSHSNNCDVEFEDDSDDRSGNDLPECPYGESCYRKNHKHRKEYKHISHQKTRERTAKKKAAGKIRDDNEDGPNDYDYGDSFIDDDELSESEVSEDSDWIPSCDENGDDEVDDVSDLLTEARNFTRNKKMLKPA
ncbi:aprataxin and PNK-like factor [Xenia sp. Carnegie-2017]|uniref:aprataxin and PNK-like factor n=1 Tax=Xenia sp. Carnegie-2017 TaxID=2897299 RepID=UPI001F049944|nr:aprataxin and PNK-like factor [Xenia sp. Carnegie-2017]